SAKKKEAPSLSASSASFVKEVKKNVHGVSFFAGELASEPNSLKELGDQMIDKAENKIICLLGKDEKSIKAFVWVHKDIAGKVKAGDILKEILAPVEGRGGGKPNFAQGGAPSLEGM